MLLEDLKQAIAQRQAIVIVGAGVSSAATGGDKLASWNGLIEHGIDHCVALGLTDGTTWRALLAGGDVDELVTAAELVGKKLGAPDGGEYRGWLRKSVGALRPAHPAVIEALDALGVPLATTNYDHLLTEVTHRNPVTWQDGHVVERVLRGDESKIVHLHGSWERSESVILGIRDYAHILGDIHAQTMLQAMRATKTLLFVGCGAGLQDPNFGALLKWTRGVFAGSEYRHYRLARESEVAALQKLHPAEERIFVLPYGKDFGDLAPFLRTLAAPPSRTAPAPGIPSAPARLPRATYCFGREAEVGQVVSALLSEDTRPIALLGPPGIGKSAITLAALNEPRVAARFGDRRWFLRCDGAQSVDLLIAELARVTGLPPGPDLRVRLLHELGREAGALGLDNLETPWEAATEATEELLRELSTLPRLMMVASLRGGSRPAGLEWRESVHVRALDLASARQLFLAIAGQSFAGDPRLDQLLRDMDGVPLAIRLLAHFAEGEPDLAGVEREWRAKRTAVLKRGSATSPSTNLAVSFELPIGSPRMTPEARRLLFALALLPDGVARDSLDAIWPDISMAVMTLRREGLVVDEAQRVRLLAPMREHVYAAHPPDEADRARVYDHYLALARSGNRLGGEGGAEIAARMRSEFANTVAVLMEGLQRSARPPSLDGIRGLANLICVAGIGDGAIVEATRTAFHAAGNLLAEATCSLYLGRIALNRSRHEAAEEKFQEALPLFQRAGDVLGEAECTKGLGNIAFEREQLDLAQAKFEEGQKLYRRAGVVTGEAHCIRSLGSIALQRNELDLAEAKHQEALPLYRQQGELLGEAGCILGLGVVALRRRQLDAAQAMFEEALKLYRRVGGALGTANCVRRLGDVALERADRDGARRRYQEALALYAEIHEPISLGEIHRALARVAVDDAERDRHVQAAREFLTQIKHVDLLKKLDDEFGKQAERSLY
jgi:tetratricopeptide (TPR) repeat protein